MEKLISTNQLVRILGVSRPTLLHWRKSGLPYIQINSRVIKFNLDEVNKWILSNKVNK